jgi:hypothetical protein
MVGGRIRVVDLVTAKQVIGAIAGTGVCMNLHRFFTLEFSKKIECLVKIPYWSPII